jgi:BirA family biotin operon repressor/biotin-[acetyl-CoA-carboxylase] ligase
VPALAGLTLTLAIAVATVLRRFGAAIQVKWPNDMVWQGQKVGGLLLETRRLNHRCEIVFGLGLNYHLPHYFNAAPSWTDLATVLTVPKLPGRNALAAQLINTCLPVLQKFPDTGLSPYLTTWHTLDALAQHPIELTTPTATVQGTALGVDEHGALRVQVAGYEQRYQWGEVSVRPIR